MEFVDWFNLNDPEVALRVSQTTENIPSFLSRNPNAVDCLEANPQWIDWTALSRNPNAVGLLFENQHKIEWWYLSANPNALPLIEANKQKINWYWLGTNPSAMSIIENSLKQNPTSSNQLWGSIARNTNPRAIEIIRENMEKVDLNQLCANPSAVGLLEEFPEKIGYRFLLENPNAEKLLRRKLLEDPEFYEKTTKSDLYKFYLSSNPCAISILKEHPELISWSALGQNPNPEAMDLIVRNQELMDIYYLSKNPNAFHILETRVSDMDWFGNLLENPCIFEYKPLLK